MPQLGLGLRANISSSSPYDGDAAAYFTRAGIGSDSLTPSAYDAAASFNGTNQALSLANNSTIQLAGTNFTLAGWINLTSLSAGDRMIFAKNVAGVVGDYVFAINSSGQLKFARNNAGWEVFNTTATVSLNSWVHCAIVLSGLNLTFYINGTASGTATLSSGVANQTGGFAIGRYGEETGSGLFLGQIGPCAIWKRALSSGEITTLYNSGFGTTYASLDASIKTSLVSWWALNGTSVTADSHGSNTLTNNNSVTATLRGPIVTEYTSSRLLINNFVKGVKALGIYNSMVCWPLRSAQNAGTGATAYSLGGLGIYNGTLVNGPSWTADGIDHTAASSQTTTFPLNVVDYGATGFSLYFVGKPKTGTQAFSMIFGQEGGTTPTSMGMIRLGATANAQIQFNVSYTGGLVSRTISANAVNTFNSFGATVSPSSVGLVLNASTSFSAPSGTYNAVKEGETDSLRTASRGPTNPSRVFADLISSFGLFTTSTLDASQHASLISLYKTTLGTGLGLP
jgi:hypothetical protein